MLIKVKLSLCLHTTTINRIRDSEINLHPSTVELGRWMGMVSFKHHHPLYSRNKSPGYPLDRKMGEPKSQSGHSKEIIPAPVGFRNSIVQTVVKEIISKEFQACNS
jgi:hypothetical protein